MTIRATSAIAITIALMFVLSCSEAIPAATDTPSLIKSLSAAGMKVAQPAAMGKIDSGLFAASGSVLTASGEEVLAYEFESQTEADEATKVISVDGRGIGSKYVNWTQTPHFFRSGALLVIYDGEQKLVIDTLTSALGPQFAGG